VELQNVRGDEIRTLALELINNFYYYYEVRWFDVLTNK
jgi:hypothetical protein